MKSIKRTLIFFTDMFFFGLALILTLGTIVWILKQPIPVKIRILVGLACFALLGFMGIAGVDLNNLYGLIGLIITLFLFVVVINLFA